MRARSAAALLVLAAGLTGCGHHAVAIPHLAHVAPTARGRSFLVDLPATSSPRYVRLLRREALAARAEPVDFRAAGGAAAATLAVSDPAAFLKHRLKRFLDRTLLTRRQDVYLRIVDGRGGGVLEFAHEGASGSLWIRRDVFECSPIQPISVPVGAKYPRCAA